MSIARVWNYKYICSFHAGGYYGVLVKRNAVNVVSDSCTPVFSLS